MNKIIAWFANNNVAANIVMFGIVAIGLLCIQVMPKEILPSIEPELIQIQLDLKNANSEQVEQQLCRPTEQLLASLKEIKAIYSYASSETCQIDVELFFNQNTETVSRKINQLLAATTWPEGASKPKVHQRVYDIMVTRIALSGHVEQSQLLQEAERIQQDLINLGLSKTVIRDAPNPSIDIRISQQALQHHAIGLAEVAKVLNENQLSLAAGKLISDEVQATLSLSKLNNDPTTLADTVIRQYPDGSILYLDDLASIQDHTVSGTISSRVNGSPAITLSTYQDRQHSTAEISQKIQAYIDTAKLPEQLELIMLQDNSRFFTDRMQMLQNNALSGLLLVFLILWLFLRLRLAFWVSAGIPMAFLGGFIVLYLAGASLNMVSTFGLLLVLGIVTDDAVIVGENINKHQNMGKTTLQGAIDGAQEMALPVFIAVITTAITFVPLAFLPGAEGQVAAQIPLIVIAVLAFSLIECFFVLPAHLGHGEAKLKKRHPKLEQLQRYLISTYQSLLHYALQFRYATLSLFIGLFALCISLLVSGWLTVDLRLQAETEVATAVIQFPEGSNTVLAQDALIQLEESALRLRQTLHNQYQIEQIGHIRTFYLKDSHSALAFMNLASLHDRKLSGDDIMQLWRKELGDIPEASRIDFSASIGRSNPHRLQYTLSSSNAEALQNIANQLKQHLQSYVGVSEISDSLMQSKKSVDIQLLPAATQLGLDLQSISQQVQWAFSPIHLPPIQKNQQWTQVTVALNEEDRSSLWHLENLPIALKDGSFVPLHTLAKLRYSDSPQTIKRLDGERIITVNALINPEYQSITRLKQTIENRFLNNVTASASQVKLHQGSDSLIEKELLDSLWLGFAIALLVMYIIMAMLFASYWQPLLILTAVPFGFVGSILGHLITGTELTYLSLAGMIAVSGIVINDEVIMVHHSSQKIKEGISLYEAVSRAGEQRFLAVFLTSLTTFFGILPIMLEPSWEAQFLTPLAVSIAFGVMFSTLVTLVFLPSLHLVCDDIAKKLKQLLA